MPDPTAPGLPRIALVSGEEADAAHVRDALDGLVDIVYAVAAVDFDAGRMAEASVVSALLNVDGGDWLEAVEASLDAAGIPVVYNDPDISRGLEGWPRARWSRHLVAKLRGSRDVDPPRPATTGTAAEAMEPPATPPSIHEATVVERPLSPTEIETMTADFVAIPQAAATVVEPAAPEQVDPVAAQDSIATPADPASAPEYSSDDRPADSDLDVDTEALSAMIDARLADVQARPPEDSPEVWRLVETPAESAAAAKAAGEDAQTSDTGVVEPTAPHADAAPRDDTDVFASLPSLDDWQLVDNDAAPAPAAAPAPVAAQTSGDTAPSLSEQFAGLELVPIETGPALAVATDPIERWLHESEPRNESGGAAKTASGGSRG